MKIQEVSLLNILPSNLLQDEKVRAAAQAIDAEIQKINDVIPTLLLYKNIDLQHESMIDELAKEEHVDFYDITLPMEVKRELVKNSAPWHRRKGTPSAVEELITTVFGSGEVVEWHEYGGEPYTFKVVTNNKYVTDEQTEAFIKVLNSVIRLSAKLEKVELSWFEELNVTFAGFVHTGEKIELRQVE